GGVAPTLRLDPDLAAQRERVNGLAARRLDTEAEHERRRRRVGLHAHADDRAGELAPRDRPSRTSPLLPPPPPTHPPTPSPPPRRSPRQRCGTTRVGPWHGSPGTRTPSNPLRSCRPYTSSASPSGTRVSRTGFACTPPCHASSGSSDSVAPAGLG